MWEATERPSKAEATPFIHSSGNPALPSASIVGCP
jgi:hypothetical protein